MSSFHVLAILERVSLTHEHRVLDWLSLEASLLDPVRVSHTVSDRSSFTEISRKRLDIPGGSVSTASSSLGVSGASVC